MALQLPYSDDDDTNFPAAYWRISGLRLGYVVDHTDPADPAVAPARWIDVAVFAGAVDV